MISVIGPRIVSLLNCISWCRVLKGSVSKFIPQLRQMCSCVCVTPLHVAQEVRIHSTITFRIIVKNHLSVIEDIVVYWLLHRWSTLRSVG